MLERLIKKANEFASRRSNWEIVDGLQNPQYLIYCLVEQIAREAPHAVVEMAVIGDVSYPEEILSVHPGHLMIVGAAGYGKTSFCRWSVLRDVEALAGKRSSVIPVYIRLHQLATRKLGSYQEEFFEESNLHSLLTPTSASPVEKLRFYLDGLDEVSSLERQRELIDLARTAAESDSRIQVDRALKPLMSVPLLATLTVAVYKKTRALPENRVRLYDIFTDLLLGGWDLAKNVRRNTKFGGNQKLMFLSHLAGSMHTYGQREVRYKHLLSVARKLGSFYEKSCKALTDEIVEDGLLSFAGTSYMFAHLSFQEYLAAKDLNDPTGQRQAEVLKLFFKGSNWWREVLLFYVGIAARPSELHKWINEAFSGASSRSLDAQNRYQFLLESMKQMFPGWTAGG